MSTIIYKFGLKGFQSETLQLPKNAKVLCVINQHEKVYLWAEVEIKQTEKQSRTFEIYGTGQPFLNMERNYVGSFQQANGLYIGHVYELIT